MADPWVPRTSIFTEVGFKERQARAVWQNKFGSKQQTSKRLVPQLSLTQDLADETVGANPINFPVFTKTKIPAWITPEAFDAHVTKCHRVTAAHVPPCHPNVPSWVTSSYVSRKAISEAAARPRSEQSSRDGTAARPRSEQSSRDGTAARPRSEQSSRGDTDRSKRPVSGPSHIGPRTGGPMIPSSTGFPQKPLTHTVLRAGFTGPAQQETQQFKFQPRATSNNHFASRAEHTVQQITNGKAPPRTAGVPNQVPGKKWKTRTSSYATAVDIPQHYRKSASKVPGMAAAASDWCTASRTSAVASSRNRTVTRSFASKRSSLACKNPSQDSSGVGGSMLTGFNPHAPIQVESKNNSYVQNAQQNVPFVSPAGQSSCHFMRPK